MNARHRTSFDSPVHGLHLLSVAAALIGGAVVSAGAGMVESGNAEDAANNATNAATTQASNEAQLGQEQLDFDKQQYNDSAATRAATSTASLGLMNSQTALANQQAQIAGDTEAYDQNTFQPLEKTIVANAENYDTPAKEAEAASQAEAGVESSYGAANDELTRSLARSGVTYGGGRSQALLQDAALAKASASAGAGTAAARNVQTTGTAMMADAANLGRNLPSAEVAQVNSATSAAAGANSSGATALADEASGIPAVNAGYAGDIGAAYNAGNLYDNAAKIYGQTAQSSMAGLNNLGTAFGKYAGTDAGSEQLSDFFSSSRKVKRNTKKPLSTKAALAGIEATPVKQGWQYDPAKGGPADGGMPHDGPMAEDVQSNMGDDVAPGGTGIDVPTMNGHLMAGMQELGKRVKKLESGRA